MTRGRAVLISLLAIAAMAAYAAWVYPALPDRVPTHWNIHGQPDGWSHKSVAVAMAPGLSIVFLLMLVLLPLLSREQLGRQPLHGAFNTIMALLQGFAVFIHAITIHAGLNERLDVSRALIAGFCLLMAAMGNLMGRTRRNSVVGIRTPWTLANDLVWRQTHRLAGRLMVGTGLAAGLGALVGVPPWLCFVAVVGATLWPCVHSYLLYRRLAGEG
ncbi:MAG TPA: SdpI family protein [Chthonomonadales bacterium]|nr:SdpI family protein [Chthonomonadales bacterium]